MTPGSPGPQAGASQQTGAAHRARPLSQLLADLATDAGRERIAVADLLAQLHDRALAALLFVFALPNVIPGPPGLSTLLGMPLVFLSAQLAFGRPPRLPRVITERSVPRSHYAALITRAAPFLARAEALLKPRFRWLSLPPLEYAIGLLCLLLAVILVLPIPLGNSLPALSICLLALGVLERDGLWVLAGLGSAAVSLTVVSGVLYAMARAAMFLLRNALV